MTQQEFAERYHYDSNCDLLGKGGFGRVYRAYDRVEHEYVAIKVQSVDPEHPELRLRNEVEKVQQYVHRYIARYKGCYTFSTIGGEIDVAVMKYYKYGSLDSLLKSGTLSINARHAMLRQILEGIAFLHSHGIIHRDLKPQNILIAEYNGIYEPLITDFGISKQLADDESSAVYNSLLGGTYAYASPEQLKETTIRKNTDIWSFGVIAYQMLTGELPFNCGAFSPTSQEGRLEQFRQMTSGILPEALYSVSEPWQTLIRGCLVVDNTERLLHAEDCMTIVNDQSTVVENPTMFTAVAEPAKEEKRPRVSVPKRAQQPKREPQPKRAQQPKQEPQLKRAQQPKREPQLKRAQQPKQEQPPKQESGKSIKIILAVLLVVGLIIGAIMLYVSQTTITKPSQLEMAQKREHLQRLQGIKTSQ